MAVHHNHHRRPDPINAAFYDSSSGFPIDHIQSSLFTHLIYLPSSLESASDGRVLIANPADQLLVQNFSLIARRNNPGVKTLLSIHCHQRGGRQTAAISSSIALAREHGFDGLDLDSRSVTSAIQNFCQEWRQEVAEEARRRSRRPLILTASLNLINLGTANLANAVDVYLDWIHFEAYNYGTFYRPRGPYITYAHTALYNCEPFKTLTTDYAIKKCIEIGIPPGKIVLGLALHGFSWKLQNSANHGMHVPVVEVRRKTELPASVFAILSYKEIKKFIKDKKAKCVHDCTTESVYCYAGDKWVGYDDPLSLANKVRYLKSMKLRGYILSSLSEDSSDWALSKAAWRTLEESEGLKTEWKSSGSAEARMGREEKKKKKKVRDEDSRVMMKEEIDLAMELR